MAIDKYLFYLPPNAVADEREVTIPFDHEVALLEGEHYMLKQQLASLQGRLADVELDLSTRQPPIIQHAREDAIRRQAQAEAQAEALAERERENRALAEAAGYTFDADGTVHPPAAPAPAEPAPGV